MLCQCDIGAFHVFGGGPCHFIPGDVPGGTYWFGAQSYDQMLVIGCAYSRIRFGFSGLGFKVRGLTESFPQHSSCDLCMESVLCVLNNSLVSNRSCDLVPPGQARARVETL